MHIYSRMEPCATDNSFPMNFKDLTFSNSIGMKFRYVCSDASLVGCPMDEHKRSPIDLDVDSAISIDPFWIAETVTTQFQYYLVTGLLPSYFSEILSSLEETNYPVESVSWDDSNRFCQLLSELPLEKLMHRKYRLPTEVEWEVAARAETVTPFTYGMDLTPDLANFDGTFPYIDGAPNNYLGRTSKVRSYTANKFGLFDVHGNVWEWCLDKFTLGSDKNLINSCRVLKGGSWHTYARFCRSASRDAGLEDVGFYDQGFRVVCYLESSPNAKN